MPDRNPIEDQIGAVLEALQTALPPGLLAGVYLYGSAVADGLRRDSDLDLFAVIARRLTDAEKHAIVGGIVLTSRRDLRPAGWRPVELTIVVRDEVRPWHYPPRFDLQYGEWLRDDIADGRLPPSPDSSPDVALLVTMVRGGNRLLLGRPAADLLDPVPQADVMRAISDEIPSLLDDLASDTRNVLLTLARMWTTVATGEVRSKDGAAAWALSRLPAKHRPVLELAARAYLGESEDAAYDARAVEAHAQHVVVQIGRAHPNPKSD